MMKKHLKILFLVLFTFFMTHQNMMAADPVPVGGDTSIVKLYCSKEFVAVPFILTTQAGGFVKFEAISGDFSILIKNADKFFEAVDQNLTVSLDSDVNSAKGAESEIYRIKDDLAVGTEIEYWVVCLQSGKIVDAPPKIIIVPVDDEE